LINIAKGVFMKQITGILLAFFLLSAHAEETGTIKPAVMLNHIKTVEAAERTGDELYFDISVLRADMPREFYRIPDHPVHWPSSLSHKIKDVSLWSEEIKPGHTVILLLSLMDQNLNPLNPDDLIGVIRLELKNKDGELNAEWSLPNRPSGPVTIAGKKGDIQKFELYDKYGQYEVFLSLQK